mgnify:CR=1 FL=1
MRDGYLDWLWKFEATGERAGPRFAQAELSLRSAEDALSRRLRAGDGCRLRNWARGRRPLSLLVSAATLIGGSFADAATAIR